MLRHAVTTMLLRDLAGTRRSIEAYADDAAPWIECPGMPNTGGTLALHIAGNLRHFIGHVLGGEGYVRDRDAEFARRGVTRAEMIAEIEAARAAIEHGMAAVSDEVLAGPFPDALGGRRIATADFLVHLSVHLGYHLGQLDYHRRTVSADARGVGLLAPAELPAWGANGA